jgi:hypothetical protein
LGKPANTAVQAAGAAGNGRSHKRDIHWWSSSLRSTRSTPLATRQACGVAVWRGKGNSRAKLPGFPLPKKISLQVRPLFALR